MDVFIAQHQDAMKRAIKEVDQYDRDLKSLSTWWEKIALIGKINSLDVASTILEDMETTLEQFHGLQEKLIESLVSEHARKVIGQNWSRCQVAIDVLIRNLFERTADIGFLATDDDVVRYLKKANLEEEDRLFMQQRLQAYIDIYSVYHNALLLTPQGEVVFELSQPSRTGKVNDAFIQQALDNPDDYVEYFGITELMGGHEDNLLYANAVVDNGVVIGVIVLSFRFQNELEGIINHLLAEDETNHFLLLNSAGNVLFAPFYYQKDLPERFSIALEPQLVTNKGNELVQVCAKGTAYQGYAGPKDWLMSSLVAIHEIESNTRGALPSSSAQERASSTGTDTDIITGLVSDDLLDIRNRSTAINDDLELIVLNGIITAARKEAVEFMPVLEAIKKIGRDIDGVFADSISSLFTTIISGQLNAMRLQASLAVDIMDRNLYERANDCRWWGLNSLLRAELSSQTLDQTRIEHTLAKIHSLYTVYHTLYVFDRQGRYVAFSDDQYKERIGHDIEPQSAGQSVFELDDIYSYRVSDFVPFDCYDQQKTYIYNAAIRDSNDAANIVGGIGIVFDSSVEFKAILQDILPKENGVVKEGSFALFTTETGEILSSTSEAYNIGQHFMPEIDVAELKREGTTACVLTLSGHSFLIGAAQSAGYREYKRDDGYINDVIAWVMMPC
ncbi:hypothetical protein [Marinomonas sp. THO17]|uniref:hypothetical protein n=1 Tax=Marinomonas sp. THO17 TaxID=3149048 RepID=UPI00336C2D16